jgi:hypothetical protein
MMDDRLAKMMINTLNDLTKTVKTLGNQGNVTGGGASSSKTRMGRGGASNGKAVDAANQNLSGAISAFKDFGNAMRNGGTSKFIDGLKKLNDVANPLAATFRKLDDIVQKSADGQSKATAESTKAMRDYIVASKGNLKAVQDVVKMYGEYSKIVDKLAGYQEETFRNEKEINKALKEELALREELNKTGLFDKDVATKELKKYFTALGNDRDLKLSAKGMETLSEQVGEANDRFKALNDTSLQYVTTLEKSIKSTGDASKKIAESTAKFLVDIAKVEGPRIVGLTQSRLQTGFGENEFRAAMGLGVTSEALNTYRAQNRDMLSAMSGFRPGDNLLQDGLLKNMQESYRRVGLTSQDALDLMSQNQRASYNTGRGFGASQNNNMIMDAQVIQQAFGGTIAEASAKMNDFATQVYNIQKFNSAQTKEEQEALNKELRARMLLTKYMGYDVEYLKQQDAMRQAAQFGDVTERVRAGVMGEVSANMLQRQFGWSDAEKEVWSKSRRPGATLTNEEQMMTNRLQEQVVGYKSSVEARASAAGNVSGWASTIIPLAPMERMIAGSGGSTMSEMFESSNRAIAQRRSRGDISETDYLNSIMQGAQMQAQSVTKFEDSVQAFGQFVSGMKGLPGASTAGGLGGAAMGIATTALGHVAGDMIMRRVFKGGGGAGKAAGGLGRLLPWGKAAAKVPPPIPLKLGAKAAGAGGKSLAKKIPGLGLMAGLGFAGARMMDGDALGATLEAGSGAASTIPILGTAASLGIDGVSFGRDVAKEAVGPENAGIVDKIVMGLMGPSFLALNMAVESFSKKTNSVDKITQSVNDANKATTVDENGNPVSGDNQIVAALKSILNTLTSQNDIIKEGNNIAKDGQQNAEIARKMGVTVQEHMENLSQSTYGMFSMPS